MRFLRLLLFCFLLPVAALAQDITISGKVVTKASKSPVQRASVFLSNSSFGTISGPDGSYELTRLRPGQYTLVVTAVGFEDFTKKIQVGEEPVTVEVELEPKVIQLREVIISTTAKADWRRNFEQFKKDFIGADANAKLCTILNPEALYFTYHKRALTLEAETDRFLVIDNLALGYRVKFLLKGFKSDGIAEIITYGGERLFEELPGSKAQKKIWDKARDDSYYGSAMHFYRSLYTDKLAEEGFELHHLTRYLNPDRPTDEVLRQRISRFKDLRKIDSANHYIELANMSKYYMDKLTQTPYASFELLRTTQTPGIFAITCPNYLYVMYTKKRDETNYKDIFRPLDMPNYETSVITFTSTPPVAYFDKNGIVVNGEPLYEGTWSQSRLSQLLPVDYVPTEKR
ncbi:carboxypeptidase-like regulatory domain-containing protein [Mucilaginibacter sp. dw_454]|uniref:carboxypeptidase-like regulatory domain-containing protein n=1 Tax=Mucilaginibacter sp. dw_454 TaxID=2720079 RepID=UPI001BD4FC61|nr:carboxypeptidase-like regulatory domain-containing protein [Mucilaginibacter sp. dw_454]